MKRKDYIKYYKTYLKNLLLENKFSFSALICGIIFLTFVNFKPDVITEYDFISMVEHNGETYISYAEKNNIITVKADDIILKNDKVYIKEFSDKNDLMIVLTLSSFLSCIILITLSNIKEKTFNDLIEKININGVQTYTIMGRDIGTDGFIRVKRLKHLENYPIINKINE